MTDRLKTVVSILKECGVEGILISNAANIFYLTGYSNFSSEERECYLIITSKKKYLLTDGRYIEAVRKQVLRFEILEITQEFSYTKAFEHIFKKHSLKNIGVEESNLRVDEYKKIKKAFKKVKNIDLKPLRILKDEKEIEDIHKACKVADKAVGHILNFFRTGVSEIEVAWEFEKFIKENGGELSFKTIIAFGENAAIPHHQTGNKKLKKGDLVLIDCGAKVNGYCSDMTRTYVFEKPSYEQKLIHQTVLDAQQKAIEYIGQQLKKGEEASGVEADKVAREYIKKEGFSPYSHGLGHGTGILIHEPPSLSPKSKDSLKEGMVFSIEPGIYISGFGGVRIEDLFVIKNNKLVQLTNSPKELREI